MGNVVGVATIANTTITGNATAGSGGGLFNDQGTMTVSFCTLHENSGPSTGGLAVSEGSTTEPARHDHRV